MSNGDMHMNKYELHSSNMVKFDISYKAQNCKEAPLLQNGIKSVHLLIPTSMKHINTC